MAIPENNLVLHLDADAIEGLNDNDTVETWSDLSGEENDVTQETLDNRPLYKTNVLSGKPVVRFDGTNDSLRISSNILSGSSFSVFIVKNQDNTSVDARSIVAHNTDDGGWPSWSIQNNSSRDTRFFVYTGETPHAIEGTTSISNGVFHIVTARYSSSADLWDLYVDGRLDVSGNKTGSLGRATDWIDIGYYPTSDVYYKGDIAEILIYDSVLSTQDKEEVERYLGNKWLGWATERDLELTGKVDSTSERSLELEGEGDITPVLSVEQVDSKIRLTWSYE